jgi:hypothetical protein
VAVPVGIPPPDRPPVEFIDVPPARLAEVRRALLAARRLEGYNVDPENERAWVTVRPGDVEAARLVAELLHGR